MATASATKTAHGSWRPLRFCRTLPATLVALFVAAAVPGTVALMPLYPATEKHWTTAEYSLFYVFWGISGSSARVAGLPLTINGGWRSW